VTCPSNDHNMPTRVIIEHYGIRSSIERDHSDVDAITLVTMFFKAALAAEYMPQSICRAMKEVADNERFQG